MKVCLVRNPAAGSADESEDVADSLARLGEVRMVEPASAATLAEEVAAAAEGADVVAVAGGDGTFGCVVNALADRLEGISFALLPAGTGNDLARTLGFPIDAAACARSLDPGAVREIDVGKVTGGGKTRLFVNACMGGFPVEVDEALDGEQKRRLGALAFWVGGVKAASDLQRARVVVGGSTVVDCVAVGVGNGRTVGGGIEVWPEADPADGVLEVCALGAPDLVGAARVALRVIRSTHGDLDAVHTESAPSFRIQTEPEIEFNVDGELLGITAPAEFSIAGKLRLLDCAGA